MLIVANAWRLLETHSSVYVIGQTLCNRILLFLLVLVGYHRWLTLDLLHAVPWTEWFECPTADQWVQDSIYDCVKPNRYNWYLPPPPYLAEDSACHCDTSGKSRHQT